MELYYPCSENKGADQLRGYREADLRLCFRLCRLLVFPRGGSIMGKKMPPCLFQSTHNFASIIYSYDKKNSSVNFRFTLISVYCLKLVNYI